MNEIEEIEKALHDYGYSRKAIGGILKGHQLLGEKSRSVHTRTEIWNI